MIPRSRRRIAAAFVLGCALPALAQQPPDAGGQLRDLEKQPPALPRKPPPRIEVEQPARPPLKPAPAVRFVLKDVRFSGNSAFAESELKPLLQDLIGREIGFAELEEATARITRYYRERGYLVARAYLPQQEIRDGVVEIAVLEGRLGRLDLKNRSRVRDAVIERHFDALTGDVINEDRLERKLLLLSDLPGIGRAAAALRPGERVGESALALDLTQPDAAASASAELDNYGSHFTGEFRLSGELDFASPTGYGDQLTARVIKGLPGLDLVRLAYQLPVGGDGLKVGAAYSALAYRLGKEFAALGAHGRANAASATLSYPFIRARSHNLNAQLALAHRTFEDRIDATMTDTHKSTDVATLGVSGDLRDALGGGAINAGSLAYSSGRLDIETADARTIDEATLRSHGSFHKLNWNLLRAQRIAQQWSVLLALSGQRASKNLDSSEKFTLGGPYGVRAFALGEASGDQGVLGNAELRFDVEPAVLQAFGFLDAGEIKVNRDPPPGSGNNERRLWAAGAGLNWTPVRAFSARAIVAWSDQRTTSGPARSPRVWLQALYRI